MLKYFPSDPGVRAELAKFINEICSNDAEVEWLGNQAVVVYTEWPGPLALRQLLHPDPEPDGWASFRHYVLPPKEVDARPQALIAAAMEDGPAIEKALKKPAPTKRPLIAADYTPIKKFYKRDEWPIQ